MTSQIRAGADAVAAPTSNELAVLEAITMACEAFAGARRLEPVLKGLLASALHLAQADAGSIMLLSARGDTLQVVAAQGPHADRIIGVSQPVDASVSGWVLREGRTAVLEGRSDQSGAQDARQPVSAHPRDLASAVVVPLRVAGRVLGVLSASRAPGTPRMEERTVNLLELVASQAAILIDNAQLSERETASLRERAQLLELAFEAIVVRDLPTGAVSFWNPGAERLYGWSQAEAYGKLLHTALATQFPEPVGDVEAALAQHGTWEGELTQTRFDGSQVIVSSRWALQRDEHGRAVAVLEINRDITSQKRAAAELQATLDELQRQYQSVSLARSRVQAILDATSEAIALLSADNTTLSVNQRFTELFLSDLHDASDSLAYDAFVQRARHLFESSQQFESLLAETMFAPHLELRRRLVQAWPERRDLELYSCPVLDASGVRLGRLFVFRDTSLEQAADRAKTEFVSMISHELRTPLTSINGYVDLLLDGEFGKLNIDQRANLSIVRRNGDHLLALINDLLETTRFMSGRIKLKPEVIGLADVIEGAVETLAPHIAEKAQQLSVDVLQAPRHMRGDPQRLRQVFVNLLSNAHKYTPAGGQLRLQVRALPHAVYVDVQDSGIGMSADEQAQLFTKFFRADNPVTRQVSGTGLGLVITRSLVEMHGGTITVCSAPGEGSTFTVMLPVGLAPGLETEAGDLGVLDLAA